MKPIMLIFIVSLVAGCAGTKSAYQAADGIDQNAKVVAEHYYALVKEANTLKDSGILAGGDLVKAQQLVRDSRPAIDSLVSASQAFEQTQTATTEAELNQAIAKAAIAISGLIDIIKAARSSSSQQKPPPDLPDEDPDYDEPPLKKAA